MLVGIFFHDKIVAGYGEFYAYGGTDFLYGDDGVVPPPST